MVRTRSTPTSFVALILVLALGGWIWFDRYGIYDWIRLWNYHPSAEIVQIANQTTMTPYARTLFYVYHPRLDTAAEFNQDCTTYPQTIVLGCTVVDQGIYIYNVKDPQLNGIVQVTAAYEMLHVAYSRLSNSERVKVDNMINAAYNQLAPTDPTLVQERNEYLKEEGAAVVPNELHSVFGTEVANLPPDLAAYYTKYFTNRQAIISLENQYQSVFTNQQAAVANDDQQLATLKAQIDQNESELSSQAQLLSSQRSSLQAEKSAGEVSSYNASVPGYNSRVDSYNALANQTTSLINQYNQLVVNRNNQAVEENQLVQEISSTPSTISSQ